MSQRSTTICATTLRSRVSILLPYRNAAKTLREALESMRGQRDVEIEIVAINDGSTDESAAIVAAAVRDGAPIVGIGTSGVGIARALTAGLARATAPFIARMDADDVSTNDRLVREVALLATDSRLAAAGSFVEPFPSAAIGLGLRRYVTWQNSLVSPAEHAREIFIESPLCHPSVVIRREALDGVGGWRDVAWPEDYDLWLRLDAHGWRLAKVPAILHYWRHAAGRATFGDARYAPARFFDAKAPFLAARLRAIGRPVAMWGAGPTGKRLARAMESCGIRVSCFVDIDPRKIGRTARRAPIVAPEALRRGEQTVVVVVGSLGARDLIREHLVAREFVEGEDFIVAA